MGKERLERFAQVLGQLFVECYQGHKSVRDIAEPDFHSIEQWRVFKDKQRTKRLLELADGDVGKCEQYLRLPAYEFHKLMSYHVEQNQKKREQNEKNRQRPERNHSNAEWQTNEQGG